MPNEIAKRGDSPATALQNFLTMNQKQLVMALPDQLRARPERFIRLATTALVTTPQLQNCNMLSICNSVMLAAQLGLEPNNGLGHGWLIPYAKVCTFQPGYRGLLDLGYRAQAFKAAQPQVVYVGDDFEYEEGATPKLFHRPAPPSRRTRLSDNDEDYSWIGAYCRVVVPDGSIDVMWMWKEEIEAVRAKASRAGDNSPWVKWFWEMVRKTPVKRHMKFLRLSPQAALGVGVDDQAEAFHAKDYEASRAPLLAQDNVIDAVMEEQALAAEDVLRGSREQQQQVAAQKIEQGQQEAARRKREPRQPKEQPIPTDNGSAKKATGTAQNVAGGQTATPIGHRNAREIPHTPTLGQEVVEDEPPLFAEPQTPTIPDYLPIIGEQAYWRILGSNGYDEGTIGYVKDSHRAAILRDLADEVATQAEERK